MAALRAGIAIVVAAAAHASNQQAHAAPPWSTTVQIPGLGSVHGTTTGVAREFRGVPYATPPVGALRWQSPLPLGPWTGVRDATQDAPGCIQHCGEPYGDCPATVSEDCLYLNVFTPAAAPANGAPLPVVVFIHGGNFRDGFPGGMLYNGTALVSGDPQLVVVSIAYRLGALGFLHGPDAAGDPNAPQGNYGLQDQRAALQWVHKYIGAFGGDPSRVTCWGQSAGSMSVATHLVTPASRGLCQAAYLDSQPFALPFRDAPAAEALASAVTYAAGCDGAPSPSSCLRSLSSDAILAAQIKAQGNLSADSTKLLYAFMPFTPTTGTPDAPNWPLLSWQGVPGSAPVEDVPVFVSTTSQEGVLFIYGAFGKPVPAWEYAATLEVFFGAVAGLQIGLQYPVPSNALDTRMNMSQVATDAIFYCAARNATRSLAALRGPGGAPALYRSEWASLLSWGKAMWGQNFSVPACWDAVCHGEDLPSLWHPVVPGRTAWTSGEDMLSAAVRSHLASFVATAGGSMGNGASNGEGALPLDWPATNASTSSSPRMVFALPARSVQYDDGDDERCALFDQLGYVFF